MFEKLVTRCTCTLLKNFCLHGRKWSLVKVLAWRIRPTAPSDARQSITRHANASPVRARAKAYSDECLADQAKMCRASASSCFSSTQGGLPTTQSNLRFLPSGETILVQNFPE